ncbi:MAG: AmmeMemoRadiSam system protein A, partial [Solobacterium sp.]|nr:AmmeMemoRadiSam system protein A [Solobacterium sp.]
MIVKAIMVPHPPIALPEVGHGEEAGMQATLDAYAETAKQIAQAKPDTVIVLSP